MSNEEKKEWYTALFNCYFEHLKEDGTIEILDPTTVREVKPKVVVDQSKVIYKAPIMIYEHKSKP